MMRASQDMSSDSAGMESEDSFFFEESYKEPASVYITESWDTMMEEYYDEYDDFQDIDVPTPDDDI